MRRILIAAFVVAVPGALAAQQEASTLASAAAHGAAQGSGRVATPAIPTRFSAEGQARLQATVAVAAAQGLPMEPIAARIAEGEAKAAGEAQVIAATSRVVGELRASQEVFIRTGRPDPSPHDVTAGAHLLARGATQAQIEGFLRAAPTDRSLLVAFDALTRLEARGMPVAEALVRVGTGLSAGVSDRALLAVPTDLTVTSATSVGAGASLPGSTVSAAGAATGAVGVGVIRRP